MKRIDLNQKWKMKKAGTDEYIPATVPGSVYNDLINAGLMDDPYYRDNEDEALELMKNDFIYSGSFDADTKETEEADEVILRFNGLDTIADIELNGIFIGSACNMHRIWDYSVKDILKPAGNKLTISFHSPVRYIAEQYANDPANLGTEDAMKGFPKIRKGHYMFGWDWGPRLPDAGIWREVELLAVKRCRISDVNIHQNFNDDLSSVKLRTDIKLKYTSAGNTAKEAGAESCRECSEEETAVLKTGFAVFITVEAPDGTRLYERASCLSDITVDNPLLWWPNGLGGQPLYTVTVELADPDGRICDTWSRRIGIRKMELSTRKDEYGSEFAHVVNDVKFFAMGADYIPSIDYYGRWKALHYYAKRFFAPFMISCEEEGLMTQTLNVNAEPFDVKKSIRLSVAKRESGRRDSNPFIRKRRN